MNVTPSESPAICHGRIDDCERARFVRDEVSNSARIDDTVVVSQIRERQSACRVVEGVNHAFRRRIYVKRLTVELDDIVEQMNMQFTNRS